MPSQLQEVQNDVVQVRLGEVQVVSCDELVDNPHQPVFVCLWLVGLEHT